MTNFFNAIFAFIFAVTCQFGGGFLLIMTIVTAAKRFVQKDKPDTRFGYELLQNCKSALTAIFGGIRRLIQWIRSMWTKHDCTTKCKNGLNKTKTFAVNTASNVKSFAIRSVGKVKAFASNTAASVKSTYANAKSSVKNFFSSTSVKRVAGMAAFALLLLGAVIIGYNANDGKAVEVVDNKNRVYISEADMSYDSEATEATKPETTVATTESNNEPDVIASDVAYALARSAGSVVTEAEGVVESIETTTTYAPTTTTTTTVATTVKTTKRTTTTTAAPTTQKTTKKTTTTTTTTRSKQTETTAKPTSTTKKTTTTTEATTVYSVGGWASVSEMEADLRNYAESFGLAYCYELKYEMGPNASIYSTYLNTAGVFKTHCMDAVSSHAQRKGANYELFQVEISQIENGNYRVDLYFG